MKPPTMCMNCHLRSARMGGVTCGRECHEAFIVRLVEEYGPNKRVIDHNTGVAYSVPTRDIIERGLKQHELDRYPRWPD